MYKTVEIALQLHSVFIGSYCFHFVVRLFSELFVCKTSTSMYHSESISRLLQLLCPPLTILSF